MKNCFLISLLCLPLPALAEVRLSNLFSDNMVLQRDIAAPIWGWADPGEEVSVSFQNQTVKATADLKGEWRVALAPMPTNATEGALTVKGKNSLTVSGVLVGEVWVCSGQSNMEWSLNNSVNADLEKIAAGRLKNVRFLTVRTLGQQEPVAEPDKKWVMCAPDSAGAFSAVGYAFGKQLADALNVPIGLIDNSWGGSACEAWVRRDILEKDPSYAPLMERWKKTESEFNMDVAMMAHKEGPLKKWEEAAAKAKAEGKPVPQKPRPPQNALTGNSRPGNLYNGRLKPVLGYGIRGAIWYQGESNASRAFQYRDLFPKMIQCWREDWKQGDFPFYWVQLADFKAEKPESGDSDWAELREAQTMTLKLPATGEAVIVDLGEANDIHPRKKIEVGLRLSRHALAKNYGITVPCQSALYDKLEIKGNKAIVTLKEVGSGLRTLDVPEVKGFLIAGEDKRWKQATAKIIAPNQVEVSHTEIAAPVAVRYAWADNPVCNLYSKNDLPVTPFRTDDWPGVTTQAK